MVAASYWFRAVCYKYQVSLYFVVLPGIPRRSGEEFSQRLDQTSCAFSETTCGNRKLNNNNWDERVVGWLLVLEMISIYWQWRCCRICWRRVSLPFASPRSDDLNFRRRTQPRRMLLFCCLAIYRLAGSLPAPNLFCTLLRVLDTESLVMVTFWFPGSPAQDFRTWNAFPLLHT